MKLLAFAIIYFVWGSTFLAIRIGVSEVPPFLLASLRFLAVLIFVLDYGLLFWAEQRVPSGIAAVILAMIPMFMALSEIIFLRTQRLTVRLALALLVGIGGIVVLVSNSLSLGGSPIDRAGAVALIIAAMAWSIAAALNRKLPLPSSKVMSSGAQMLAGGVLLAITAAALGEFGSFHPAQVSDNASHSSI